MSMPPDEQQELRARQQAGQPAAPPAWSAHEPAHRAVADRHAYGERPNRQRSERSDHAERGDNHPVDRNAPTEVGRVVDQLIRFTRQLPLPDLPSGLHKEQPPPPSRERIQSLVHALGNPQHPEHAAAVDRLVAIGLPALGPLTQALDQSSSWLTAYRAAEALGAIGDGRAAGSLIRALRHPNSNVRWNAIRALSMIGDLRAVLALRRVANDDPGRTSWGESVAGTAQNALDHLRAKSVWGQGIELVKTAITSVLMILSLVLAFTAVTSLQAELNRIGRTDLPENRDLVTIVPPEALTPEPESGESAPVPGAAEEPFEPTQEPTATPVPTPTPIPVTGTVLNTSNVRPAPSLQNEPIGFLNPNDEVVFLARTAAGDWYLVRLGETQGINSSIDNPDGSGTGWISQSLVTEPDGEVPVWEEGQSLSDLPSTAPTATPTVIVAP